MGCRLWGRTESDTTEATWRQQQQQQWVWKRQKVKPRGYFPSYIGFALNRICISVHLLRSLHGTDGMSQLSPLKTSAVCLAFGKVKRTCCKDFYQSALIAKEVSQCWRNGLKKGWPERQCKLAGEKTCFEKSAFCFGGFFFFKAQYMKKSCEFCIALHNLYVFKV